MLTFFVVKKNTITTRRNIPTDMLFYSKLIEKMEKMYHGINIFSYTDLTIVKDTVVDYKVNGVKIRCKLHAGDTFYHHRS